MPMAASVWRGGRRILTALAKEDGKVIEGEGIYVTLILGLSWFQGKTSLEEGEQAPRV